ncbi:hypothetical protein [Streptomyces sp. N50]|uniref:hypothetical protein n=1 Tax=Streptomyces sp. N50 TaxID=3081765 RepID=UPI0029623041|nr:hypothetical protein [Streptomyces sp. N50]WOX13528.1 hypothetical protein R2B38_33955 [Streptomyces sp. N50]
MVTNRNGLPEPAMDGVVAIPLEPLDERAGVELVRSWRVTDADGAARALVPSSAFRQGVPSIACRVQRPYATNPRRCVSGRRVSTARSMAVMPGAVAKPSGCLGGH